MIGDYDPTELPNGSRRLEIVHHSRDAVDGYLGDAQELLDEHDIPADERGQLRLLLVQLLASRQVLAVDENPRQQPQLMPMPGGIIPGLR